MLKVNVGMSRKISRDYNSTGFSVNLEGEILANLDDPEAIVERVKEFYDLAEESLAQQIERSGTSSTIESADQGQEIVIDFIQPDEKDQQREIAKKMYDAKEPEFKIAETLGVSRSRVTHILDEVFELLGEEKPDGRTRRSTLDVKHKEPPLYQSIADDVMKLYDQRLLLGQIADALEIDRNTVTSSVKFWHEQRGLPVPDGRTRKIYL